MEILFPIFITVFYLLLDALNACRAFDSRMDRPRMPANPITKGPGMLYVFARWLPSQKIRMDLPVVYYIPCDSHETAKKLADIIQKFGTEKGSVIDLPGIISLEKYVSSYYQITHIDLSRFPISTDKLLGEMK